MKTRINLEKAQELAGLLETNDGIVTQSVVNTDLEELLTPYLETVDYQLYFNYGNRMVIGKYIKDNDLNTTLIHKAIYYALKGNEYNLRTLIATVNLDYDPINNYEVHETIETTNKGTDTMNYGAASQVNTSSISSFGVETVDQWGQREITKDDHLPKISRTESTTHGAVDKTIDLGNESETRNLTKTIGERTASNTANTDVSAYNVSTYQPSSKVTASDTKNSATDTDVETTTKQARTNMESTGEYTDTKTFEQQPYEHTDTDTYKSYTDTHKRTENPHSKTSQTETKEKTDTKDIDYTENKQRDLKGRYGFTTVQSMIEAERNLANLNITERIIAIIIHQICEGVLYVS